MVDHESLIAAFATEGTAVNRADPARLAGAPFSDSARRILTEIGLPEVFSLHVNLDSLGRGSVLLREVRDAMRGKKNDQFFYLGSGLHDIGILLNGHSGEVFAHVGGQKRRISPSLDSFVEFLYLMQVQLNETNKNHWSSEEEIFRMREATYAQMTAADAQAMAEAGDYWRDMFEYSI
ncbi:SUKH-4 family immunity protein [Micromonospora matsumotoense]|uniref:SUKH-4 family immunity protein n=1 Tax=Micromonospora matsumotoense TaxID=121616 RepID=UPI003436C8E5